MLQLNRAERFASRLGLTLFDLIVYGAMVILLMSIGLLAVFGLRELQEKVIFMQMDDRNLYELWLRDAEGAQPAQQITNTRNGIWEFDTSADGRYVAYTEMNFNVGARDIYVLDLTTGITSQVTSCATQDADCYSPKFRSDGRVIAYERALLNTPSAIGPGAPRIWLIDLNAGETFPLIDDDGGAILGTGAVWSEDGSHIAFFDNAGGNILVYRFEDGSLRVVRSSMGVAGALSPNGNYLVYPEISVNRGILRLFDTETNLIRDISNPADLADEQYATWSLDGRYVAIGRRPGDMRGTQIFLLDTWTFNITPLLIDEEYNHSGFSWNGDGTMLTMTRFRQVNASGDPFSAGTLEVWTYNTETRRLNRLTEEGTFALNPQWLTPPNRIIPQS
jgi:Tol biopolymer transport system component